MTDADLARMEREAQAFSMDLSPLGRINGQLELLIEAYEALVKREAAHQRKELPYTTELPFHVEIHIGREVITIPGATLVSLRAILLPVMLKDSSLSWRLLTLHLKPAP